MSGTPRKPDQRSEAPTADDLAGALVLPGGKVDPDAIRRAVEQAGEDEDDAELRRVVFTIQRDLKSRLDSYLTSRITFMSRNQLQRLIEGGGVLVNGRQPKPSTRVSRGDVIEVVIPPPPDRGTTPQDIPLTVLHEDAHLIVLNKQADIIVHPARSELSGTMINALAYHFKHRSGGTLSTVGTEFARPGVVHRLDRHTTGCIVFAKDDEAHWKLGHQFEHRRVEKRYLALVHGHLEPPTDIITLPLGPHPSREKGYREKYVVRHDELGKPAVTIYRVLEWYGDHERDASESSTLSTPRRPISTAMTRTQDNRYSLVELELKTGRTHQIRVHLSHLGWPIVGDDMYGGKPLVAHDGTILIARQALHAGLLAFTHPVSDRQLEFRAPLPPDLRTAVAHLRTTLPVHRHSAPGTMLSIDDLLLSES